MVHKPPTRLGLIFGLCVVLALALLEIGLAVLILSSPVTVLTVLRSLLVVLALPVMGVVLYGLAGLSSASYSVDRNVIVISWGSRVQIVPMSEVKEILRGADLSRVVRFRGLWWPGCWIGRGRIEGVGAVRFFCTMPTESHLIINTAAGSYAISPENADRFMDLYAAQREMGASQTVEPALTQPRIVHRGFFCDRLARWLLVIGGILSCGLWVLVAVRFGGLAHTLPLHFDTAGVPDRMGAPAHLFTLALLGTVAWLVDGVLGYVVYRRARERMGAYLLWGAAAGLQILLWIAIGDLTAI